MTVVVRSQRETSGPPAGVRRWVHVGEDAEWRMAAERGPLAGLSRMPMGDRTAAAAVRLRRPFLDWIADLGVAHDSFAWWASPLAAKNVYSFLFARLCALAAALEVLEDDSLLVCSTPALATEIAQAARARGLEVEVRARGRRARPLLEAGYAARLLLRTRTADRPAAGDDDVLIATWVDERSFGAAGEFVDPHFGPLAGMLEAAGRSVSYLARPLPGVPVQETAERLRSAGVRAHLPDAYLTRRDRLKTWRGARAFAPAIDPAASIGGVPVARLAREHVVQERANHAEALVYGLLVERLAAAGVRPRMIVIGWEGHAWETALIAAAAEHLPGTEVVGYDNVNFSSLALSLYPGRAEVGRRPLPARVVTNGRTFATILEREGFPPERIRVGCALRHAYLYERPPREPSGQFVLAAASIDATQSIELVEHAREAFGDELVVKLHPAADVARIKARLGPGIRYASEPIGELLPRARLMLYTYSVVPWEALAAGVPPVFFRSESFLDLDQLEPVSDLRWTAGSPAGLRAAAAAIADIDLPAWRARARTAVEEALHPPAPGCVEAFLS